MNSPIAWPYDSCELTAASEFNTAFLDCSRSGSRSTVLGLGVSLSSACVPYWRPPAPRVQHGGIGRRPGEASALNRNLRSTGRVVLIYTGPRPGEQNGNPSSGRWELRALRSRRTPKGIMQFRLLALVFEGGVRLRADLRRNRIR
jgi:hypothetical protein